MRLDEDLTGYGPITERQCNVGTKSTCPGNSAYDIKIVVGQMRLTMLEPVQDFKLPKPADRAFDACQTPYCYVTWINSTGNRQ